MTATDWTTVSTPAAADVTGEPVVSAFPLGSYDRKPQRTIDYSWIVSDNGATQVTLELSVYHMAQRGYVASVNNTRVEGHVTCGFPMSAQRVAYERVARYSKGTFQAFAARTLSEFRERVAAGEFAEFIAGDHAPAR